MRRRLVRRPRRAASPSVSCPNRSATRMWVGRRSARCCSVRRLTSRRVLCLIPRGRPGRPVWIVCRPGRRDLRRRVLRQARMRLPPRRVSGRRTSWNARSSGVLLARRLVDHPRVGRHRRSRQRRGWRSCKRFLKNEATSHRRPNSVPSGSERRSKADDAASSTRPGRDRTAPPPVGSAPRSRRSSNDGGASNPDVVQRAPRSERPPSPTSLNQAGDKAQRAFTAEDPRTGEDPRPEGANSNHIVGRAESLSQAPAAGVHGKQTQLADRRMQRLISQDLLRSAAMDEARSQAVNALRERADESPNNDVQRPLSVSPPAAAPSANVLQGEIAASSAPPSLTRIDAVRRLVPQLDGGTLRRVSLPRALSTTHRPQNAVGVQDGAIQRVVSPRQSQIAMASVMNLAVAGSVGMRPDPLGAEGRPADGAESVPGSPVQTDRLIPSVSTIQRHVSESASQGNLQSPVGRSQGHAGRCFIGRSGAFGWGTTGRCHQFLVGDAISGGTS